MAHAIQLRSRFVLTFLLCILTAASAVAAGPAGGEIPRQIEQYARDGGTFDDAVLFTDAVAADAAPSHGTFKAAGDVGSVVREATLAQLDLDALAATRRAAPHALTFALPYAQALDGAVELELVRSELFADSFDVETSTPHSGKIDVGVHYRGMVRGEPSSLAAISLIDGEVMGFVSSQVLGTLVVGRMADDPAVDRKAADAIHVIYAEEDLEVDSTFACAVGPTEEREGRTVGIEKARGVAEAIAQEQAVTAPEKALSDCVDVYIEADYDIYQQRGSTSAATSFLTGLFNQVATLYANENINTQISSIFVWSSPSPYSGGVSSSMLNAFYSNRPSFTGDLAHLVNFKSGGGIAWVDSLCGSSRYRRAVSGLNNSYSTVPTYSWSVEVFTHEMGHNLGSPHTQKCAWNGNNTAIDGCYPVEGSCPRPGLPSGGGTIMSYCHLASVGINFNKGFGSQPGNLIRNRVSGASCLNACSGGGGGGGCSGTNYTGSLSGSGDSEAEPNGTYYYSSSSGTHRGVLSGPGSADFDLELYRWTGSWTKVAEGISPNSSEDVSYNGSSGYYYWRVRSYSGSGSYSLCLTRP